MTHGEPSYTPTPEQIEADKAAFREQHLQDMKKRKPPRVTAGTKTIAPKPRNKNLPDA